MFLRASSTESDVHPQTECDLAELKIHIHNNDAGYRFARKRQGKIGRESSNADPAFSGDENKHLSRGSFLMWTARKRACQRLAHGL